MAMFIDPEAAAYGVFQIAFATMDTRLSRSLVTVCRCISFRKLSTRTFGWRLAKLRQVIGTVEPDLPNDREIHELKTACDLAESVQKWRNDRIHAEVQFAENRPVLVDSDGKPLEVDREECEQKIRDAIRAGVTIVESTGGIAAFLQDLEAIGESPERPCSG
jgi:hypothetical protein